MFSSKYSKMIVSSIPLGELAEAFAEGNLGGEAEVALKGGGIGVGGGDIARLHGDKLLVRLEVVVGR